MKEKISQTKFLSIFNIDNSKLADNFLSFSLLRTNQLMAMFGLLGSLYGIYLGLTSNNPVLTFVYCTLDSISFICCLLIFLACFNQSALLAYWGYIISEYKTIVYFYIYFFYIFFIRIAMDYKGFEDESYNTDKNSSNLPMKIFENIIKIPFAVYFLFINFSFMKLLALDKWKVIQNNQQKAQ